MASRLQEGELLRRAQCAGFLEEVPCYVSAGTKTGWSNLESGCRFGRPRVSRRASIRASHLFAERGHGVPSGKLIAREIHLDEPSRSSRSVTEECCQPANSVLNVEGQTSMMS